MSSNFTAWISEFIKRFTFKSPRFFQIVQYAGLIATAVGFIPDALVWLNITPTDIISKYITLALKVAGGVTYLIAKLPVSNSSVIADNSTQLPFTQKKKIEGVEPTPEQTLDKIQK